MKSIDDKDFEFSNSSPVRKLQPGEILDVDIKLRQFMSAVETTAFTLYASFEELGDPALEKEAEKARHTLELATARVASLLSILEKTPHYVNMRKKTVAMRKSKRDPEDQDG